MTDVVIPVSVRVRAINYLLKEPNKTATQVAHALEVKPSTVSSVLYKGVFTGDFVRVRSDGAWRYALNPKRYCKVHGADCPGDDGGFLIDGNHPDDMFGGQK